MIEFWWVFGVGTIVFLILSIGLISSVVYSQRTKLRLEREKYASLLLSEQKAKEMQSNLQLLSGRILQMSEEERRHISRELHDEVGQLLTGLSMNLEVVRKTLPEHSNEVRELIIKAQGLTEKVLEQIHSFLVELRPAVLDELGLLPAIRNLAGTFQGRSQIQVSVSGDPSIESLGSEQKIVLYRVVQESLTNAFKHSEADKVNIDLQRIDNNITLEITDNGRGFEIAAGDAANRNGNRRLGILGMKERVKLIEGTFDISSKENQGTQVLIQIPVALNGVKHG